MAAAAVALCLNPAAALGGSTTDLPTRNQPHGTTLCSSRIASNYASSSSALFSQSKQKLTLSTRRYERAGRAAGVVATMAPPTPLPPVDPDASKSTHEPSVGMEEAVRTEEQQDQSTEEPFVWRDHWYPVSLIEDLDPSVPTPFQLLGRELVVWKDPQGEWRVFLDKCPHRLAPLSVSPRSGSMTSGCM